MIVRLGIDISQSTTPQYDRFPNQVKGDFELRNLASRGGVWRRHACNIAIYYPSIFPSTCWLAPGQSFTHIFLFSDIAYSIGLAQKRYIDKNVFAGCRIPLYPQYSFIVLDSNVNKEIT